MASAAAVKAFAHLYGEDLKRDFIRGHLVLFLLRGSITITSSRGDIPAEAPAITSFLPFHPVKVTEASPDAEAVAMVLGGRGGDALMLRDSDDLRIWPVQMNRNPLARLSEKDMDLIRRRLELMEECNNEPPHRFWKENMDAAFTLLSNAVSNIIVTNCNSCDYENEGGNLENEVLETGTSHELIFRKFSESVATHIRRHHSVNWYANQIGVSLQHLSRVFRALLGISPKEYIDYLLTGELLNMIGSTSLSLKEIAYECGFDDTDAMGRFFKRNVGRTLSEWREAPLR